MANSGDVTLGLFYIWAQDFILEVTCYDAKKTCYYFKVCSCKKISLNI